jgi:hypothetical protein
VGDSWVAHVSTRLVRLARRSLDDKGHVRRIAISILCLVVVGLAVTSEARSVRTARGHLFGTVSRTGRLVLKDGDARQVRIVRAGVYALTVRDRSNRHNFHFAGTDPGVNRRTGIRFVGTVTWNFRLVPGVYRCYSDRRPSGGLSLRVTG